MLRVYLAELRDSWAAWLGVSLTFIAVNASLAVTALTAWSGLQAGLGKDLAMTVYWSTTAGLSAGLILLVSVPVISSATSLVVGSRRGALARLALAGATPRAVRTTITTQLAAVSLACALIGDVIALAAGGAWMELNAYSTRDESWFVPVTLEFAPEPLLVVNLLCVALAVAAGARQARQASEIPPIEALRQSQAPIPTTRLGVRGWLGIVVICLAIAICIAVVPGQLALGNTDVVSNTFAASAMMVFLSCALLAAVAPVIVKPVTRAWTRLIPSQDPAWLLARATVGARADRLYKSVVPVLFTLVLGVAIPGIMDSGTRSVVDSGLLGLTMPGWADLFSLFGLPILIAFCSGVGSLIMMSRQRDAELALAGIVGATPEQRVRIPAMEAAIITGTAAVLALFAIIPSYLFQGWAFTAIGLTYAPVFSYGLAAGILIGGLVLTALTTVLPTLPAMRLPAPRVIARLVAE